MSEKEFDIARSVCMTEGLQCQMLTLLSNFYEAMHKNASKVEKTELLADLETALYLMAQRLGISPEGLDKKAAAHVRLRLLQEDESFWRENLLEVLNRLEK